MKSKKIIESILSENAINAKKLIEEDLAIKLGERLAEEYVRIAKITFNEEHGSSSEEEEEETMDSEMDSEEKTIDSEDEEEEMMEASDTELAAMYPPKNKITRGDIIAAAQKKGKKGKK
jgi:hypothetical protein